MTKVHIITQNEPFFIPKMIKYLLSNQNDDFTISSFTVLKPHRKNKSLFHWFKERAKVYTYLELLIASIVFVYVRIISKLHLKSPSYSVRRIFNKHSIEEIKTADINSDEYIKHLKKTSPDVIISISCPQIFKKEILEIPKEFCINAHGTLLPRHRGVFGTWWTLFSNDKSAGSTIHTMEERLDAGKIIWQKSFTIEEKDTQYSLAYKTKRDMAFGLVQVLKDIKNNSVKIIQPKYETTYNRAPGKKLGSIFHKKGYKVIKLKDLKYMLSKSYEE